MEMKTRGKRTNRMLAFMLTFVMVFSSMTFSAAWADETDSVQNQELVPAAATPEGAAEYLQATYVEGTITNDLKTEKVSDSVYEVSSKQGSSGSLRSSFAFRKDTSSTEYQGWYFLTPDEYISERGTQTATAYNLKVNKVPEASEGPHEVSVILKIFAKEATAEEIQAEIGRAHV